MPPHHRACGIGWETSTTSARTLSRSESRHLLTVDDEVLPIPQPPPPPPPPHPHPRPCGRVPMGRTGEPCVWDGQRGVWCEADGSEWALRQPGTLANRTPWRHASGGRQIGWLEARLGRLTAPRRSSAGKPSEVLSPSIPSYCTNQRDPRSHLDPARTFSTGQRDYLLCRQNYCCRNPEGDCPLRQSDGTCPLPRRQEDGSLFGYQVDHILRWADGGSTTIPNGQVLCAICHSGKTSTEMSRHVKEWARHHVFTRQHGWVLRKYRKP